jgi:predicted PurR-regulated permease PerM
MGVPSNKEIVRGLSVVLIFLGAVVLFVWLLTKVYIVLVYFAVAGALSIIGRPIVDFISNRSIKNKHLPRWFGALVTMLIYYIVVLGFIALFIPLIVQQVVSLGDLDLNELIGALQEPLQQLETALKPFGVQSGELEIWVQSLYDNVLSAVSLQKIFAGTVGFVSNLAVALFTITFTTFFLLKERGLFNRIIMGAVPDAQVSRVKNVLLSSRKLLRRYLIGLMGQLTIFALLVTIGLSIVGVDYAFLIAVIAGFLNIIPYLGPLIGGSVGVLLSLTAHPDYNFYHEMLPLVAKVIAVFWGAQILDNNFVQPNIFATVVKAHPLEIFLVVLSAGMLAGIPGMIVAIPAYTLMRIIAREFFSEFKIVQSLTGNMEDETDKKK